MLYIYSESHKHHKTVVSRDIEKYVELKLSSLIV